MNQISTLILVLVFFLSFSLSKAETWNEPWQKEIIEKSEFFVLGKVLEKTDHSLKVQIIKNFGTKKIEDEIIIDDFFMLNLSSSSGHGTHFILKKDETVYLFLQKNKNNNYSLPTPTSGFAEVDEENNVSATYRHSYHQTFISKDVYELTYQNIWNYYKEKKFDKKKIAEFINTQLNVPPAGFEDEQINQFFLQHAALETAYLLNLKPDFKLVLNFANSENYHSRISALQLMGNIESSESKEFLFGTLTNEKFNDFEKVIAIWSLKRIGDKTYIKKLKDIKDKLSEEQEGFDGNIMNPRVGTYFPSPKEAVESL